MAMGEWTPELTKLLMEEVHRKEPLRSAWFDPPQHVSSWVHHNGLVHGILRCSCGWETEGGGYELDKRQAFEEHKALAERTASNSFATAVREPAGDWRVWVLVNPNMDVLNLTANRFAGKYIPAWLVLSDGNVEHIEEGSVECGTRGFVCSRFDLWPDRSALRRVLAAGQAGRILITMAEGAEYIGEIAGLLRKFGMISAVTLLDTNGLSITEHFGASGCRVAPPTFRVTAEGLAIGTPERHAQLLERQGLKVIKPEQHGLCEHCPTPDQCSATGCPHRPLHVGIDFAFAREPGKTMLSWTAPGSLNWFHDAPAAAMPENFLEAEQARIRHAVALRDRILTDLAQLGWPRPTAIAYGGFELLQMTWGFAIDEMDAAGLQLIIADDYREVDVPDEADAGLGVNVRFDARDPIIIRGEAGLELPKDYSADMIVGFVHRFRTWLPEVMPAAIEDSEEARKIDQAMGHTPMSKSVVAPPKPKAFPKLNFGPGSAPIITDESTPSRQ